MKRLARVAHSRFAPLFVPVWIITVVIAFGYAAVQQSIRLGANGPLAAVAESTSEQTAAGSELIQLGSGAKIDISHNLNVFAVMYDNNGIPVTGSGYLHNQLPRLPQGIFNYARNHTDDRVTWQPESGTRAAIIVRQLRDQTNHPVGFVMAGSNLREVERLENTTLLLAGLAWSVAVAGCLAIVKLTEEKL